MEVFHIIYASSAAYAMPMTVSAASVAFGARKGVGLVFHVLDMGLTDEQWSTFEKTVAVQHADVTAQRHHMDLSALSSLDAYHGSYATYARLFMFRFLDDSVKWAMYLDGDTLCVGDITRAFDNCRDDMMVLGGLDPAPVTKTELPDFQWCRDRGLPIDSAHYLCGGVLLMNIAALKEFQFEEKVVAFLKKYGTPPRYDQTVVNSLCYGRTGVLPREWGVFSVEHRDIDWTKPALIHYACDVPWRREKVNRLMSDVVMLWYAFAEGHLHLRIRSVSAFSRMWRRTVFLALKQIPWVMSLHPYLAIHLRNVYGIPRRDYRALIKNLSGQGE